MTTYSNDFKNNVAIAFPKDEKLQHLANTNDFDKLGEILYSKSIQSINLSDLSSCSSLEEVQDKIKLHTLRTILYQQFLKESNHWINSIARK